MWIGDKWLNNPRIIRSEPTPEQEPKLPDQITDAGAAVLSGKAKG